MLLLLRLLFLFLCPFWAFLCGSGKKNSKSDTVSTPRKMTPKKVKGGKESKEPSKKKKRSEKHVKKEKKKEDRAASVVGAVTTLKKETPSKNTPVKSSTKNATPSTISAEQVTAPSPDPAPKKDPSKETKDKKQEDSFDKLKPQVREAIRTPEIKGQLANNEGDYKTLNMKKLEDFDSTLQLSDQTR